MNILGISFSHGDSSAALVINGKLVAAAEEERFTRVKHYALFPKQSIESCLAHANLKPSDINIVAIARKPWNVFQQKLKFAFLHPKFVKQRIERRKNKETLSSQTTSPHDLVPYKELLAEMGITAAYFFRVEHHLAHMASCRFLTKKEKLPLLTIDGLGDFVSAALGVSKGKDIRILRRVLFPDSLGFFYTAMTQYLGFPYYGDEFKVMGLSSYGKPKYLEPLRNVIREKRGFRFQLNQEAFPILENNINFRIKNSQPHIEPFFNRNYLTTLLGIPPRRPEDELTKEHKDLAKSVQMRFEEVANHLVSFAEKKIGGTTLGLAGGCAHNSVWVGKIPQNSKFRNILVAPAAGDAGIASGAALYAASEHHGVEGGHWALVGPKPKDAVNSPTDQIPFETEEHKFRTDQELANWIATELANEKIIGICRDRMEFGPRALGSRSIIADPRPKKMRDRLNKRVKHRESFRPFAASVLADHQGKWFEDSFNCDSMEAVFKVVESKRTKIEAVVHADHTCRIQSVHKKTQSFYWKVIEAFNKKTGVPMIINTSFNDGEPVVCTESDAIRCFGNTEMDHLVLENRVISRVTAKKQNVS